MNLGSCFRLPWASTLLGALVLASCTSHDLEGTEEEEVVGSTKEQIVPQGVLASDKIGEWTWHDVPGTRCGGGEQTGFGVNIGPGSEVLIYLQGGGLCWDEITCGGTNWQAPPGFPLQGNIRTVTEFFHYDATTFTGYDGKRGPPSWVVSGPGSVFDRTTTSPYKDATFVYVPYCTGDFHSGTTTQQWASGRTAYYNGRNNLDAYIDVLTASLPNVSRVTLAGSSAGAFGATINYEHVRQRFNNIRVDLVADAGPYIKPFGRTFGLSLPVYAGMEIWNAQAAMPQGCTNCWPDITNIYKYYSDRYTDSKFAFVINDMDMTVSAGYLEPAWVPVDIPFIGHKNIELPFFPRDLNDFARNKLVPLTNTKFFIPHGSRHGLLDVIDVTAQPRRCDSGSSGFCNPVDDGSPTGLRDWLTKMHNDDPSWSNATGMIMKACTPQCDNNQCGPDGCGNVCGFCGSNQSCDATNQCVSNNGCTIAGVNYANGERNPANSCQICDHTNPTAWSVTADNCFIGGQCYKSDDSSATDLSRCNVCAPSTSQTTWTNNPGACIVVAGLNSAGYDGTLGLSTANSLCAQQGATKNLTGGTWKALLSTSTQNLKDIVPAAHAWKQVVNLRNDYTFPSWNSIFTTNQVDNHGYRFLRFDGSTINGPVRTGANADGTTHNGVKYDVATCVDWTQTRFWSNNWWEYGWHDYTSEVGDWTFPLKFASRGTGLRCGDAADYACVFVPSAPADPQAVDIRSMSNEYTNSFDEGTTTTGGYFTINRVGGDPALPLTVNVALSGTATRGTDYNAYLNGAALPSAFSVTIPAGQKGAVFTVNAIDDSLPELDESIVATIVPDAAYKIRSQHGSTTLTIRDNDVWPTPQVSIAPYGTDDNGSVPEQRWAFYKVSRPVAISQPLTVKLAAMTGTATQGADYTLLDNKTHAPLSTMSVTIRANEADAYFILATQEDGVYESPETAIATIAPDAAYTIDGAHASATVTITDSPTVSLALQQYSVPGLEGAQGVFWQVTRNGPTTSALTVDLAPMTGTATKDVDYVLVDGTSPYPALPSMSVTIPAGSLSTTFAFWPTADTLVEPAETAIATIAPSSTNAYKIDRKLASATAWILDNNGPSPTVSIATGVQADSIVEGGWGGFYFIRRTGATTAPLTVTVYMSGTATKDVDYVLRDNTSSHTPLPTTTGQPTATVTIPAGSTGAWFLLGTIDDTLVEGAETAIANISANAAYTIDPAFGAATATIIDND